MFIVLLSHDRSFLNWFNRKQQQKFFFVIFFRYEYTESTVIHFKVGCIEINLENKLCIIGIHGEILFFFLSIRANWYASKSFFFIFLFLWWFYFCVLRDGEKILEHCWRCVVNKFHIDKELKANKLKNIYNIIDWEDLCAAIDGNTCLNIIFCWLDSCRCFFYNSINIYVCDCCVYGSQVIILIHRQ